MENEAKKGSKVAIYVIIAVIVVAVLAVGGFFLLNANAVNSLKQETVSAENYEDLLKKVDEKMPGQDDAYYFAYANIYYIMESAMTATNEEEIYTKIYGKTVQQLIDEGKQIAKDNNVTLEQIKEQIDELNKTAN
ncbi:MAG: hypothetical protein HFJ28_05660 [Clostridia bacterium]|jgi:hypothetical protein|nr:hypothetical protein [Clostridia bacterium]